VTEHERFWSHVRKTSKCWLWTAYSNPYGQFRVGSRTDGSRKKVEAHVYAFEEKYGMVPAGKIVCHTCDNPPCVRHSHLFLGTHADNTLDMILKGRENFFGGEKRIVISDETVGQILTLWKSGTPQTEIAKRLGVHKQSVWNYTSGRLQRGFVAGR
jgi:hypothetical protein